MGPTTRSNGVTNGHSSLPILAKDAFVPLIIDGEDVKLESTDRHYRLPRSHDPTTPSQTIFQGTGEELTLRAIESCQKAFPAWSTTGPPQRRFMLFDLARVSLWSARIVCPVER